MTKNIRKDIYTTFFIERNINRLATWDNLVNLKHAFLFYSIILLHLMNKLITQGHTILWLVKYNHNLSVNLEAELDGVLCIMV